MIFLRWEIFPKKLRKWGYRTGL